MSHTDASRSALAQHAFSVLSRPKGGSGAARLNEATLSAEEIEAISKEREARWRPGLADQPFHSEIFASARDASGAGLALALARDALRVTPQMENPLIESGFRRHVLWVQDSNAIKCGGRPYLHGLPSDLRDRLIHVEAKKPQDALFAIEEGLQCRDLACVIGEIHGNPRSLDFTASRRLSLAAEKHGIPLWMVRLEAEPDLSSARMRWRAESSPSSTPDWNVEAPGSPRWKAELFRARRHAPGQWIISDDETLRADQPERKTQPLGSALARNRRYWHPGGAPAAYAEQTTTAPDPGYLVRATVGRSLAARARL